MKASRSIFLLIDFEIYTQSLRTPDITATQEFSFALLKSINLPIFSKLPSTHHSNILRFIRHQNDSVVKCKQSFLWGLVMFTLELHYFCHGAMDCISKLLSTYLAQLRFRQQPTFGISDQLCCWLLYKYWFPEICIVLFDLKTTIIIEIHVPMREWCLSSDEWFSKSCLSKLRQQSKFKMTKFARFSVFDISIY